MSISQDVRYALRTLRRRPAFTAVAVATLGLGIGATTAIFSVVDAVLLRPLPFRESESLVSVNRTYPHWREDDILRASWDAIAFSYPKFTEWREAQTSFSEAGAWATYLATVSDGDHAALLTGVRASPSLLPMLGVQPLLGRTFLPEEGLPSAPRVVVLSHETWVSRYGADPNVIGRMIRLDDTPFSIIGVLPARVNLAGRGDAPAIWIPAGVLPADQSANNNQFRVVARLEPGVPLRQAQAEAVRLVRGDENPTKLGARLAFWQQEQTKTTRTPLLILLGAAGLLLAIACANVAMLLLGEAATREHEMASRLALGAGRLRLMRQLLTESVVLALFGAALGIGLAFAGTRALVALAPPQIPRLYEVATDLRVLAIAVAGAVATGVLFGVAPALSLARTSPASLLSAGSRSMSRRRGLVQRTLVAAELALCLILLVGGALLAQSLRLVTAVDPGFRAEGLTVVKVSMPRSRYGGDSARAREFYREVIERVGALPGVQRVSATSGAPFDLSTSSTSVEVERRVASRAAESVEAEYRVAMPGYIETVGIPLLSGRTFTDGDRGGAARTVVVNATLARQAWPNESAVGKRLRSDDEWHTVVGVVGDIKNAGLAAEPQAMFYLSALQEHWPSQRFVIRSTLAPDALASVMRQIIARVDPAVPVTAIDAMPELVSRSIAEPRYRTVLISLFGLVAAILATIGVYGVTARAVSHETREIGIRMALGSSDRAVVRLFISRTMIGVIPGVAVGLVGALAASRLLAPYLFGVAHSDLATFAGVLGLLVAVSAAASWVPARNASRTNPAVVLRRG